MAMGWTIGVRFPAGVGNFSLHSGQSGSGAHPAPYSVGTEGSFPRVMKLTAHLLLVLRSKCVALYLHLHYVFMTWCLVKFRDNFTFTFYNLETARFCRYLLFHYLLS